MKSTKSNHHELNLSVRTESGRCSVDLGLDHFSPAQRQFIFNAVAATLKGGSTGFGMRTLETGEIVLEVTLRGPNVRTETAKAVKEALTH